MHAVCSDIADVSASDPEFWSNGAELSLILYHSGCGIRQPIAPISLLTLGTSASHLANAQQQRHEQIGKGSQKLAGLSGVTDFTMNQQTSPPQIIHLEEPSSETNPEGKVVEPVNPKGGPDCSRPNPSADQEALSSAQAETLTVLVRVHPAAAREAWETLSKLAQGQGIGCTSRSACRHIPFFPQSLSACAG